MRISERDLADRVANFLVRAGGQVFAEVASLGQSADLVWIRHDEITFVEVKVNATRRAIEQCRAHELVADYICVATANKSVSQDNLSIVRELGYGLISCQLESGECGWLIEPRRLQKFWVPIRQKVITRLAAGGRDGD